MKLNYCLTVSQKIITPAKPWIDIDDIREPLQYVLEC